MYVYVLQKALVCGELSDLEVKGIFQGNSRPPLKHKEPNAKYFMYAYMLLLMFVWYNADLFYTRK